MEFKIDMTKVVKIVVEKDENTFIEYSIKDGVIVDATLTKKEPTIEEKVNELKKNNADVQKISKLIEFDNAGILDRMAKSGNESVFGTIKETIEKEPIVETVVKETNEVSNKMNQETFPDGIKDAVKIMKLDKEMNEIAKENREKIADKLFSDEEKKEEVFDEVAEEGTKNEDKEAEVIDTLSEALKITDRNERIAYLKKIITDMTQKK